MVDFICRILRDGVLEGELAPAFMISDTLYSTGGPSVFQFFLRSLGSNVSLGRGQAQGIVVVAFDHRQEFYSNFLTDGEANSKTSHNWFHVVDCYSDPLGWNKSLLGINNDNSLETLEIDDKVPPRKVFTVCRDVKSSEKLMSSVIDAGKGVVGHQMGSRFAVVIDSVSIMLRHLSLQVVAKFIQNLRCHGEISSILWVIHADLHHPKDMAALEYMSSMTATLEDKPLLSLDFQNVGSDPDNLTALERHLREGNLHMRVKRRNGKVSKKVEHFILDNNSVKFSVSQVKEAVNTNVLPQAQFNLQLTEKEREDRAKVILPFEHQGEGKEIHIYDGRSGNASKVPHLSRGMSKSISDYDASCTSEKHGKGEIHYVRDSDDEIPDSDEDPDDDLDI
eukprot:TRINITY_DN10089_c0_g1_i1.p1 TRINITY_DN10089_c0_g1~~TRINITY_DN10089_c0_g1_i1.p1  ORF type:complete len:393 (+),score=76.38 TRINITY_DN10089_c0_g1_i1:276-1454(+)